MSVCLSVISHTARSKLPAGRRATAGDKTGGFVMSVCLLSATRPEVSYQLDAGLQQEIKQVGL